MRLDEMKLTRTLFPCRVGHRSYLTEFCKPRFCLVFSSCLDKWENYGKTKWLFCPRWQTDSSWSRGWCCKSVGMLYLLKLSQDPRTIPLGHLLSAFGKCTWKGQLQDTGVAQPVETPAPREASGRCWHLGWFGSCKPQATLNSSENAALVEGHWNGCTRSVAVALQVNNPAVSGFLEAQGSVPQVIKLCFPTGANRILVVPTQLWKNIPECPVLNPGLPFCPEESRKRRWPSVFKTSA